MCSRAMGRLSWQNISSWAQLDHNMNKTAFPKNDMPVQEKSWSVRATRSARFVSFPGLNYIVGLLATIFFLFLGVPLVSLLIREPPALIWSDLQEPDVLQALQLSVLTTTFSTLLAVF